MAAKFPDIKKVRQLIPPLSNAMHKGQAGKNEIYPFIGRFNWYIEMHNIGRIGVVGGSEEYECQSYGS